MLTLKLLIQNDKSKEYFLIDAIDNPIDRELFNYNRDYLYEKYGFNYSLKGVFNSLWGDYWLNYYTKK